MVMTEIQTDHRSLQRPYKSLFTELCTLFACKLVWSVCNMEAFKKICILTDKYVIFRPKLGKILKTLYKMFRQIVEFKAKIIVELPAKFFLHFY